MTPKSHVSAVVKVVIVTVSVSRTMFPHITEQVDMVSEPLTELAQVHPLFTVQVALHPWTQAVVPSPDGPVQSSLLCVPRSHSSVIKATVSMTPLPQVTTGSGVQTLRV